jgi:hypothetical protein
VVTDLERNVHYANPPRPDVRAENTTASLESMFPDETAREILPSPGTIGAGPDRELRVEGRRANNKSVARDHRFADTRPTRVIAELGLFRDVGQQQLANRIHELNRKVSESEPLLSGLAEELKTAFEFDRMSVSRFSSDKTHVNAFFTYGHEGGIAQKRWYWLNAAQTQWKVRQNEVVGKRGTVHGEEGLLGSAAVMEDGPRRH